MPTYTKRGTGKRWRGQVKYAGRIVKTKWFGPGKKGGSEYRKAVAWEEEIKKQIRTLAAQGRLNLQTRMVSLNDWAQAYLDYAHKKFAKKTYAEKKTAFKALFQRVDLKPSDPVTVITKQLAMAHISQQDSARSGYAANKDRKNLCAAWTWGAFYLTGFPDQGQVFNPFLVIPRFPEQRNERYVPPEKDFWKVYETVSGQDKVMLLAFLHLAVRRGELFRIKWEGDVDLDAQRVRIMTRKTRDGSEKHNWLPMTDELTDALRQWKEQCPFKEAEHVFLNLSDNQFKGEPYKHRNKFLATACAEVGVKKFGFHAIRHLSAGILFQSGQPLSVIQRMLRHESPSTTERYLRSLGFDMDMEDAVRVFLNRGKPDNDEETDDDDKPPVK